MSKIYSPFQDDLYFKSNSSPIVIINNAYKIVDVNQKALDLLGYKRAELIGYDIERFADSKSFDIDYNQINLLLNEEIPHYKVYRKYFHKNGDSINIELLVSLVKDPKTQEVYFNGVFNKIDFSATKEILNLENSNINRVIAQSHVLQYILDIENNVNIYENKSLLSYLGYTASNLNGLSEFDFLDTKILKSHVNKFKKAVRNFKKSSNPKEILEIEYPIYNKQNEIVWIYDKSVTLKVKKTGEKTFSFGTIVDITERKKQEEQIKEQQLFIAKVSESIPSFIYMMRVNSQRVSFSNKRAKKVTGYSESEFNLLTRKELVHPDYLKKYEDKLFKFIRSKKQRTFQIKLKIKHKTKGYRWFLLKTIIFDRDDNQKPLNLLRIVEDIHEKETYLNKVKEQQIFIKNVTSKLPATVFVVDLKTQEILYSNVNTTNVMGYTNAYWSANVSELIHPSFLEPQRQKIQKFLAENSNKTLESEISLKHKTKGYRWYKTRLKIIKRNQRNEPEQVLEIFDDIHDVKLKNIKIAEQETLIKTITNSMSNYQYLCDIEKGLYTYNNFENRKILGYSKKEYLGRSNRLVHPDFKKDLDHFSEGIKNQPHLNNFEIELKVKHKDGHYVWVNYKVIVLKRFDLNGKNFPAQILEIVENINKAKERELKIIEQQNLIEKISTSIPELIYLKHFKTNQLIFSNNKAMEIVGYGDKEFVDLDKEKIIHEDCYKDYIEFRKKITKSKTGKLFSIELLVKPKNDDYKWFKNTTIIFERNKKKEPIKTLELVVDIHSQKQNETQIKEQQKFIEHISSTVPQYLSVYDLKSRNCFYTNFENKHIFGYTKKEYLAQSNELIHPEFREKTTYLANKMIRSQKSNFTNAIEFPIYHKERGYIWAKLKILITKRDDRGIATQALEIIEDIDKQKKSFDKIVEQQNFIQKVARTTPNIIQVLDVKTYKIIYSNFEQRTFLGYKKHEWDTLKLDTIHEKHYKSYLGKVQEMIISKRTDSIQAEILLKNKDGEYKWVLAINSIFKIKDNETQQIMSVFTDIDETKKLQLQLEKQLSKNIELERFASITSHDLKEPLRTLGNYAQILKASYQDQLDEDAMELVNHIEKSSFRMNELIEDILDFSRVHTEGKKFELINLNELIQIVLEDLKDLISESKTIINTAKLPQIEGDKTQLRQVFQNLISNAIKFTKDKTPIINIKVELVDEKYVFSVEDNGIGIKESDQKNIFMIFKKLHRQNEFEGQGIGLSICKRIIERHEGEIWLYSKLGEGTTFYFSIPKTL